MLINVRIFLALPIANFTFEEADIVENGPFERFLEEYVKQFSAMIFF